MTAFDEFAMMVKEAIDETCGEDAAMLEWSAVTSATLQTFHECVGTAKRLANKGHWQSVTAWLEAAQDQIDMLAALDANRPKGVL